MAMHLLNLVPNSIRPLLHSRRLECVLYFGLSVALAPQVKAAAPSWWPTRGVIDTIKQANDYAVANQGQVKFMAEQAAAEMDANLPGGAGDAVHQVVDAWGGPTATTNDFTAVNVGQLKQLAEAFYDRLIEAGYTSVYPWIGSLAQANDFAAANIGQVKNLFSFDLTYDSDPNGLPDWWEKHWFGRSGVDPTTAVAWNPSLTFLQAFQQGLNPKDYYNGRPPTLAVAGGDGQLGPAGGFVPLPLLVSASDSDGSPLINAPVTFTVVNGGGNVQKSSIGSPSTTIAVLTDYNGQAKVFFRLPNVQNNTSTIAARPTSGMPPADQPLFTEMSDGGGVSYASPFDATDVVATMNADGSATVTWTNNTDPSDTEPIDVQYTDATGNIVTAGTVPPGTTSFTIPAH